LDFYLILNVVAEIWDFMRFRVGFKKNGKGQIQVENSQNRKGADKNCSKQFLMDITGMNV